MKTRRGSSTELGKRMTAVTADREYQVRLRDCRVVLDGIEKALKVHEARQKKDPNNYGYVGDLGHVEGELIEVARFLRGQG